MTPWTLFPSDNTQPPVEVEDYTGLVLVTYGDITVQLTPAEARHLAGAIMYSARQADGPTVAA